MPCTHPLHLFNTFLVFLFIPPSLASPRLLLSFDFLLSTCPSLFAAIHPPASILVRSPGSVAVIMKLTDISSLAVDSLDRAKAYGDYLPIVEGATGSAHSVPAATGFFELTVSSLLHSLTLFLPWRLSTFLPLSAFLFFSSSIPVITHPQYISAFSSFPFLFLSLSIAPTHPVVIMEKSVIVLEGDDSTFSLIKDIYGM